MIERERVVFEIQSVLGEGAKEHVLLSRQQGNQLSHHKIVSKNSFCKTCNSLVWNSVEMSSITS